MTIRSHLELENTQRKLKELQELLGKVKREPSPNAIVQEETLRSLHGTIKQLKEEVLRFEAHAVK